MNKINCACGGQIKICVSGGAIEFECQDCEAVVIVRAMGFEKALEKFKIITRSGERK